MKITKGKATIGESSIGYEIHVAESDREGFMSDFKNGWPSKADIHVDGIFRDGTDAFVLRALIENDLIGRVVEEQMINERLPYVSASAKRVFMLSYFKNGRKVAETRIPANGPVCDLNGRQSFARVTADLIYNSNTLWDSIVGDKPSVATRPELEQDIPSDEDREEWLRAQDEAIAEMEADPEADQDQVKLRKFFVDSIRKQIKSMQEDKNSL